MPFPRRFLSVSGRNPHYLRAFQFVATNKIDGYVPPGYNKLRTTLLQKEKDNVHRQLEPLRSTWKEKGVTIIFIAVSLPFPYLEFFPFPVPGCDVTRTSLPVVSIGVVIGLMSNTSAHSRSSKAYFLYVIAKLVEFPRNSIPRPYRDLVSLRIVLGVVLDFYGEKTFDCDHLCHWGKGFFEIYSYLMNKTFCHKSRFKSLNATICIEFDSEYAFTTNAYFARGNEVNVKVLFCSRA
ncbi:hypothetical protein Tco_0399826 [Tanacetum coccineum]